MDVKKLFALIPVVKLKELAQKHNYITGIKAPSQMLKAELVKSLSEHYIDLTGTKLVPVQPKEMEIPWMDIPESYKPRNPKKKIEEEDPLKELKEWAKGFIRVKKAPYEISKENRESRSLQYATEKKLKQAITKRETRQAKEKAKRQKAKEDKTKVKPQKKEEKEEEEKKEHPYINILDSFYSRVKFAINREPNKDGKEYYNDTIDKYTYEILPQYNKIKNNLTKTEKDKTEKIFNKIDKILDDDEITEKFTNED